jgi:hypothetical protein
MLSKIIKIIGYTVFGLSAAVILHFFIADLSGLDNGLALMQDMPSDMKVSETDKLASNWGGVILNFSIVLFFICTVATLGFAIYQFILNAIDKPKKALMTGLIGVGIGILVLVSYSMASDAIPTFLGSSEIDITASTSKWIETFLFVMYFTFALAILGLIYNELSKIWR